MAVPAVPRRNRAHLAIGHAASIMVRYNTDDCVLAKRALGALRQRSSMRIGFICFEEISAYEYCKQPCPGFVGERQRW